jgi:23S rRNA (adenine2503-C2)-methyltransferase
MEARTSSHKYAAHWYDDQGRVDIKNFSLTELEDWLADTLEEPPRRALQLYKYLWQEGTKSFFEMPRINKKLQKTLDSVACIGFLRPEMVLRSKDSTTKFLWRLNDGLLIESVLIPDGERLTLCMSSQVGCAMACTFCLTGDLGLKRHLTPGEIANQALQVSSQVAELGARITNLVFMGMGEPLHNLPSLLIALNNCLHDNALNFSHRRVTVSTVGLVPKMAELAAHLPVNLAVSINATTEEQRLAIMPVTKKYSLSELVQACRDFPLTHGKRITFEYVMIRGFNDTVEDAKRLFDLLEGIPYKVNLIPYNENPDREIRTPESETVKRFQHHFVSQGRHCSIRTTRGTDISAACGQLGKAAEQARDRGWLAGAHRVAGSFEVKSAGVGHPTGASPAGKLLT